MLPQIPVLIVSGFLGSGKTTLVRHLLDNAIQQGIRAAVISNEFGELGIDRALLGKNAEEFVELEGGCVCCQLSDELVETLEMLRQRVAPDRIVIETSGIALPYDTQLQLWRPPVSEWVSDDLAVVVVNAEQLQQGRDLEGTFEDQVSSADLLILNKLDLVAVDAIEGLEAKLRFAAPDTPVLRTEYGVLDANLLFVGGPERPSPVETIPHTHEAFQYDVVEVGADLTPEALRAHVESFNALRVKGFAMTLDGLVLVQGVGSRVEVRATDALPPENGLGKLVVIRRR